MYKKGPYEVRSMRYMYIHISTVIHYTDRKLTLYFDGFSPLRKDSTDFSRTPDSEAENIK